MGVLVMYQLNGKHRLNNPCAHRAQRPVFVHPIVPAGLGAEATQSGVLLEN